MTRKTTSTTIADVAREAGVSISTVSRILNESPLVADNTQSRVRKAIEHLGYMPHSTARNLARRRTKTLGVLIESIGNWFFPSVIEGAEEAATAEGFSLLIATHGHLFRGERPALDPFNTDGLLLVASPLSKKHFANYPSDFPIVSVYQPAPRSLHIPLVSVENQKGTFQLIEHLITVHGLSRIAFLRGPKGNYDSYCREKGYLQAMKKYHLPVDDSLFGFGGFVYPAARSSVMNWLAHDNVPQAIFTGNDEAALDVVFTLVSAGVRVPEDVAVVGFDDISVAASMLPPLTTVHAPGRFVGREAARLLLRLIQTGESVPQTLVPAELVIRRSCGCCPESQIPAISSSERAVAHGH